MIKVKKPEPSKNPELSKNPKTLKMYECELCDFITNNKKDYGKHLLTQKHVKFSKKTAEEKTSEEKTAEEKTSEEITAEEKTAEEKTSEEKTAEEKTAEEKTAEEKTAEEKTAEENTDVVDKSLYKCECGHSYKHSSGLCRHKHVCKYVQSSNNIQLTMSEQPITVTQQSPEEIKTITTMMMELLKSNNDLQKQHNDLQQQIFDLCKINTSTISNNTINSHNKTFNLHFFLNEQCKDAMNITEFADSIDIQLSDLESVGELGYVEGITKIFIDKLNSMDIYKRPIHCSDAKREIIYVKDANVWTKEEKNNPKLRQAIKNVSFRNMKLVYNWSNMYPESLDHQSRLNDKYMKLVKQSTGGNGPILESENKIIRRIAKEIVIGKNNM